jgi:hypothetical protein
LTTLEASSSDVHVPDDLHKTIYSEIQPQSTSDGTPHKLDTTSEQKNTVCAATINNTPSQSSTGINYYVVSRVPALIPEI